MSYFSEFFLCLILGYPLVPRKDRYNGAQGSLCYIFTSVYWHIKWSASTIYTYTKMMATMYLFNVISVSTEIID